MPNRISRDRALPLDLFIDQGVHDLETTEIWRKDWIFATTVDAVADPGDWVAVTIGHQPVIVVRGDDLAIRALANVCGHRGAPLVEGHGRSSRFPCPYHAWTWSTEGSLLTVPYAMPDEVDTSAQRLASFRCETWNGLVFVSLHDDVEPLADRLSVIDPYVRPLAIERLHHDQGVADEVWPANWKVVFANAIDSYSHFRVHADTIEAVSPTDGSYYLAGSASATVTGGESFDRADHLVVAVPPSFVAVIYPDALLWQSFTPIDPGRTRVRTGMASQSAEGVAVNLPGWDARFVDEDRAICASLQQNARAGGGAGPLLGLERSLGDFHEFLAWRLVGAEPTGPFVAAPPGDRPGE